MLYLFWALLNLALFLFFIFTCLKATKLLREKFGIFASIVFVFGLLSFVGNPDNNNDNKSPGSNQLNTWNFYSPNSLNPLDSLRANETSFFSVNVDKNIISKNDLIISYNRDQQGLNSPVSASFATSGLMMGTYWKPRAIMVNRTDDNNKFEYIIIVEVQWKLLGATIYTQAKELDGIAIIK